MLIVSPEGKLVSVYRKHQLYPPADPLWAAEGDSFSVLDLPFPPSSRYASTTGGADHSAGYTASFRLCPAICMDLSPRDFTAPWEAFELAKFAQQNHADIIVCCMAWLDAEPPTDHDDEELANTIRQHDAANSFADVRETIAYWVSRVEPLIGSGMMLVTCNRIGREGGESIGFLCPPEI